MVYGVCYMGAYYSGRGNVWHTNSSGSLANQIYDFKMPDDAETVIFYIDAPNQFYLKST